MAESKGIPDWIPPLAAAGLQAVSGGFGVKRQYKYNKKLAAIQAEHNERYLQMQLDYNKPINQMARYKEAGLNPHLIYGSGTSSAGNQQSPMSYPNIQSPDVQTVYSQLIPLVMQTAMTRAQVSATDARTRKDTVVADLNRLQAQVVARNPLLNDSAFQAIIDGLRSTAEIKATEAERSKLGLQYDQASMGWRVQLIQKQVDALEQRFKLNTLDGQIKAEVLKSKEFQNAILEVQKQFMADGNIGPSQIYQFITLLLMKAL